MGIDLLPQEVHQEDESELVMDYHIRLHQCQRQCHWDSL